MQDSWITTLPPPNLSGLEDVKAYPEGTFCKTLHCCSDLARLTLGPEEGALCDLGAVAGEIARFRDDGAPIRFPDETYSAVEAIATSIADLAGAEDGEDSGPAFKYLAVALKHGTMQRKAREVA